MKKQVGFFEFTGCEGCQLSVLNLEDLFLELIEQIEIVEFREIMDSPNGQALDIAFVEGSICSRREAQRLQQIRKRSKTLVAMGACADMAGVNALRRFTPATQLCEEVYGGIHEHLLTDEPRPLADIVEVDCRIPGCPIDGQEFLSVLKSLLVGKVPELHDYSVCVECKLAELPCTFERGVVCLGPVTRAGCNAVCVGAGDRCRGCRGLIDNPRSSLYNRILNDHGLDADAILEEFRTFNMMPDNRK